MRKRLTRRGRAALAQAISGLGGIGKTQTVVEYAYRYRNKYKAVLWLNAESPLTLKAGCGELARIMHLSNPESDLDQTAVALKDWLTTNLSWLLVFDNADDPATLIPFLPDVVHGHILLSSRAQNLQGLGIVNLVELPKLSVKDATAFLLHRCARQDVKAQERHAAEQLASELDGLPLALEQAAAYIVERKATFQRYLESYRNRGLRVIEAHRPALGRYPMSMATTWAANFDAVEKESKAAADVLRFSAFLAPDDIPLEVLTRGASYLGSDVQQALARADDPLRVNDLLQPLVRFSLISIKVHEETYSIHRMVQEVIKDAMDDSTRTQWAEYAVRMMSVVFSLDEFASWTSCRHLLIHAKTVATLVRVFSFKFPEAGKLHIQLANMYCRELSHLDESLRHYQIGLPLLYNSLSLPINDSPTLFSPEGLPATVDAARDFRYYGDLQRMRRDFAEASAAYTLAKSILRNCSETESDDATSELGKLLSSVADYYIRHDRSPALLDRARSAAIESLELQHKLQSKPHGNAFEVFQSLRILADVHLCRFEIRDARTCLNRALEQLPNKTDVWQLGWVYRTRGLIAELIDKLDDALSNYHKALKSFEQHRNGIGKVVALQRLGFVYLKRDEYPEAIYHLDRAIETARTVIGERNLLVQVLLDRVRAGFVDDSLRVPKILNELNRVIGKVSSLKYRGIPLGAASSVSRVGNNFDALRTLKYCNHSKFEIAQIYMNDYIVKNSGVRKRVVEYAKKHGVEIICHAPELLTSDSGQDARYITAASDLLKNSHRRWVVHHFDEEISNSQKLFERSLTTILAMADSGLIPCIENYHPSNKILAAEDNYKIFIEFFRRARELGVDILAVIDIPRTFNSALGLTKRKATQITKDVFTQLANLGIPVILHLIDSKSHQMCRDAWCPLPQGGYIPYVEIVRHILAITKPEAIIVEYEEMKNPILSLPFLQSISGNSIYID